MAVILANFQMTIGRARSTNFSERAREGWSPYISRVGHIVRPHEPAMRLHAESTSVASFGGIFSDVFALSGLTDLSQ